MVDNILVIVMVAGYFTLAAYVLSLLYLVFLLIRESIYDKRIHKDSLYDLLSGIILGPYGMWHLNTTIRGREMDKSDKVSGIISTFLVVFTLSAIILPKIGKGTETVGSLFENDQYISYHYATLSEIDENYEPISVEVFGIAEIDKSEDTRWINNIHIDNYGTFHAFSGDSIEVLEAPIQISDIDGKHYEVRVLKSKPDLMKTEDFYTKAVGVTFSDEDTDRQEVLKLIKSGDKTITLVRDRENSHDDNAVRIYSRYGMVGFISKDLSPYIASELDYGGIVKATVSEITGGEDGKNYGCNLHMQFYSVLEKENYRPEPDFDDRN